MTEDKWLACNDPGPMLEFVRGTSGERKMRLFALACCRRIWDWLGPRGRHAIAVTERYLDGRASFEEYGIAAAGVYDDWLEYFGHDFPSTAAYRVTALGDGGVYYAALGAASDAAEAVRQEAVNRIANPHPDRPSSSPRPADSLSLARAAGEAALRSERRAQADIMRDIFHGPCSPASIRGHWRGTAVLSLARVIDEERAFDRMPMLADALRREGCDEGEVLDHCPGPGPHARGCWLLDALLLRP
jgi:hypothetical protein